MIDRTMYERVGFCYLFFFMSLGVEMNTNSYLNYVLLCRRGKNHVYNTRFLMNYKNIKL